MKRRLIVLALLVVLLSCWLPVVGGALLVRAQATPEATPIVVPAPPSATGDAFNLVGAIAAAFALGGFTGATLVGVLAGRLLKNKDALDALERIAYSTIPLEALPYINSAAHQLEQAATLVEEVTDGEPNVVAPDPPLKP